ncbi:MAG TPA: hypothetical protein VFS42_04755 [Burkholderiaceae bacterium]|nr:hypothetical protein [Burkholderiaceae bacterium]
MAPLFIVVGAREGLALPTSNRITVAQPENIEAHNDASTNCLPGTIMNTHPKAIGRQPHHTIVLAARPLGV